MSSVALQWKIHTPLTALTLLFVLLFLGLGNWQLQRAEQKRIAQTAFENNQSAAPIELMRLPVDAPMYTRIKMFGRYDNTHNFLLDNRFSHGRFGYEIITLFLPHDSPQPVLVDRGWVEGDRSRLQRPAIAPVEGAVEITGMVYRDTARFHFFDNTRETQWPRLIQSLQLSDLQSQLGIELLPFVVRIDANGAGAYRAEWQVFNIGFGPERHIAYAVTWFAMAITVVVMWLLLNSNVWQVIRGQKQNDK